MLFVTWLILLQISLYNSQIQGQLIIIPYVESAERKPENVVYELMNRYIGNKRHLFNLKIDPSLKESGLDKFQILKSRASNVEIMGTSGVAVAWGFNYYLKEFCNSHISWDGNNINVPTVLPDANITIIANDKYRYYQNVVTTSYSFVWWNWKRWEREIDWMALNGINLALAFNGQEEIWRRVYLKLGLNQTEIDEHFTGPAFLSWNRMGNLRGWGGPLTKSWHKRSVTLQKKILNRMREFGITPVLPAFAGIVPRAIKRIYPDAKLTAIKWVPFQDQYCCNYFLSPLDQLFENIGSMFLEEYIKEFKTDHIYNCDSFNEMTPPEGDEKYLQSVGGAIFKSITNVDANATWMMQGWLFHISKAFWTKERSKALLTSVPQGRMLILDLQAEINPQYERLESFFGQPFIWCMLHNFGGTLGLQGNLKSINRNIFLARSFKNNTMVGTGLTPEGINQNYVMYEFMNEMSWRKEPVNLTDWLKNYTMRRYDSADKHVIDAWSLLEKSVYNYTGPGQHGNYIFVARPSFNLVENVWYNKEDVWKAWDHMIEASKNMKHNTPTFLYDLIDISRQSLQLLLDDSYNKLVISFTKNVTLDFLFETRTFLNIMNDMDKLLETLPHFLLGRWIKAAKDLGTTDLERSIYERNARNQITLWGPTGELVDYANKQWSGLIRDYYLARWELFLGEAILALKTGSKFDELKVGIKIFKVVEQYFTYRFNSYPTKTSGNPVSLAQLFHTRWRPKTRRPTI